MGGRCAALIDVRVVAATHKFLPDLIARGLFRKTCIIGWRYLLLKCRLCENVGKTSPNWRVISWGRYALQLSARGSPSAVTALEARPWHGRAWVA